MNRFQLLVYACCAVMLLHGPVQAEVKTEVKAEPTTEKVVLETLLKSRLEGVAGTEVIVSRVVIPPESTLPRHWHPGEEFAYVLDGSVTLWQEGKADIPANAGDIIKVPFKQVHTAITGKQGVTLLVFRVHEKGQPERVLAN